MIAASPELQQFLATARSFVMADLYTITLASGQVLRYTDAGIQLYAGGVNYSASGPLIKRTGVRIVRGIEVDTLSVTLYAGVDDTLLLQRQGRRRQQKRNPAGKRYRPGKDRMGSTRT